MLQIYQRNIKADHSAHFARETTGGIDHMLSHDGTFVGYHFPFAVAQFIDRCHLGKAINLGAVFTRQF